MAISWIKYLASIHEYLVRVFTDILEDPADC